MFSSQMLEATTNRVHIKDADPDSFHHLLKFIYCAQLPDDIAPFASSLLPLADKYGVDQLKTVCAVSLKRSLEKANAVETLLLAEMHGCASLKKICIENLHRWKDKMEPVELSPLKEHPDLLFEMYTYKEAGKAAVKDKSEKKAESVQAAHSDNEDTSSISSSSSSSSSDDDDDRD